MKLKYNLHDDDYFKMLILARIWWNIFVNCWYNRIDTTLCGKHFDNSKALNIFILADLINLWSMYSNEYLNFGK